MALTPEKAHDVVVHIYAGMTEDDFKRAAPFLLVPREQADMCDWITARDRYYTEMEKQR